MELYIHIPFCRQKCRYCDFPSFAGCENRQELYVDSLLRELRLRRREVTEPIRTVYIGGGTPSTLPVFLTRRLMEGVREVLPPEGIGEYTIEANPGTVTMEWLETIRVLGCNRLSLGVQAAQDDLLAKLGRIHRFHEAEEAVRMARRAGFANLNLDLIFGIPGQTIADWRETLEKAIALGPEHISAYGLILEEGTEMERMVRAGDAVLPEAEAEREMYDIALRTLAENGYKQYEISNFARDGHECRHNIGYWTQVPYLGVGLGAASMVNLRQGPEGMTYERNVNPVSFEGYQAYVDCLAEKGAPWEARWESIGPEEARFETVMLNLRMNQGLDEGEFLRMHGVGFGECYGDIAERLEKQGLMIHEGKSWRLTRRGMDIQNAVLVEFM